MKCRNCDQDNCPNAVEFEIEWARDIIRQAIKVLESQGNKTQDPAENARIRSIYMGAALAEIRNAAMNPKLKAHTIELTAAEILVQVYQAAQNEKKSEKSAEDFLKKVLSDDELN